MAAAFSVFSLWLDCRRTQRELALFSERDLTDLGLVRSDGSSERGCQPRGLLPARPHDLRPPGASAAALTHTVPAEGDR
jgi:hypothetical protein